MELLDFHGVLTKVREDDLIKWFSYFKLGGSKLNPSEINAFISSLISPDKVIITDEVNVVFGVYADFKLKSCWLYEKMLYWILIHESSHGLYKHEG